MDWKDFFYFSRRERQGILLLIVLIAGIFLGKWIFTPAQLPAADQPEPVEETLASSRNTSVEKPGQPAYVPLYRNKQQPEHRTYYHPSKPETPAKNPATTAPYPKAEKYAEGTVIELNTADTLELMHIPGIGSSFAKRIAAYRNILGGYHRIEQLQEVYGMYEELYARITPYLEIDLQQIRLIPVNHASLDQLKAHPYINFYQAKAIIEMRKKKGKLSGREDLQLLEEFTPDVWLRLAPYLEF